MYKSVHSLSSKELHAQQGKDHNKEEEEEEQADDGFHWVEQRHHQIPQRVPIPTQKCSSYSVKRAIYTTTEYSFPIIPQQEEIL